jgi:hypothetical protein
LCLNHLFDENDSADLLGDEVFSEDVSRPGEVSVSFEAGSLGLSLRAVAEGEGSATQRVEAPAVVLGFTGTNGQAEESKIIAKGRRFFVYVFSLHYDSIHHLLCSYHYSFQF